jgi:hypothetical protein
MLVLLVSHLFERLEEHASEQFDLAPTDAR